MSKPRKRDVLVKWLVFDHYGPRCACCGLDGTASFINWERITIDHTDGNGEDHRAAVMPNGAGCRPSGGVPFYRWLIRNSYPEGFQTLCKTCNVSKKTGKSCVIVH